MTRTGGGGWSKPEIVLTIASLLMAAGGSYLALQRDDSKEVAKHFERIEDRLNEYGAAIAVNRARIDDLRDRERERERRGE